MTGKVPPSLTALGKQSLPCSIEVGGERCRLRYVFKNDFFAATALYEGAAGQVILKVHRTAGFLLPLRWVGRLLAARECAAFERLRNVAGIPALLGRWRSTGVIREYLEGHALERGERVPDDFHTRLRGIINAIHRRGMAYVDLEKCENILVGDDGRPYLFDFQICWYVPARWGGELWPCRTIRRWFQEGDRYHLRKLQRRTRPDQMTPDALLASRARPWTVRVHRFATFPFTSCRRRILDRIAPRRGGGERGRITRDESTAKVDAAPVGP